MLFAFRDEIKGNTYGITLPQWDGMNNHGPLDIITVMFGAPNRTAVIDGEVVFDFMTPEYLEALEWLRMLFEEGLINSDFVTLPTDEWNNDFMNDRAGVIIDMQSRGMSLSNLMRDRFEAEEGSDWVAMIGNFTTPNADAILPTTGFNGLLMIPTMSVQTEERLLEILTFLNALNAEEIHQVLNLGIKGVHWHFNADGNFERIVNPDEAVDRQDVATIASFAQIGMGVSGFLLPAAFNEDTGTRLELERVAIRDGQRYEDIAVFNPTQPFTSETETLRGAILGNIIADARIQFIAGQIDRAGFEAEVQRWLDSGGSDVIAELTDLYQATQ
jgi:putative aldouronate transport system substrate-binding protein